MRERAGNPPRASFARRRVFQELAPPGGLQLRFSRKHIMHTEEKLLYGPFALGSLVLAAVHTISRFEQFARAEIHIICTRVCRNREDLLHGYPSLNWSAAILFPFFFFYSRDLCRLSDIGHLSLRSAKYIIRCASYFLIIMLFIL